MSQLKRRNRELVQIAGQYGFRLDRQTNGGHLRWLGPNRSIVITAGSPSDHKWLANVKATMRRLSRKGNPQ